jgi:phosphohistidine phosphatase
MSVVVYIMRHGIAADPAPGMSDVDRALTAEGVRKTERVAVGLQRIGVKPDVILSSPLRRAEETARLVADVLRPSASIELFPPLAGGFASRTWSRDCASTAGRASCCWSAINPTSATWPPI